MAADFENLSIRISASAKDAIKKVNQLAEALEGLNAQLAAIDPSNMSRAASVAQEFGSAIKGMGSKRATKDIEAIANGMAQVTQSASGVAQVANVQEQLAEELGHVAQASQEAGQSAGGGGGSAADGMKNLADASRKAENVIKTLSAGWSGFTGTLKKAGSIFGNVAKKTFSSAMGMKKLSNGMNVAKNSAAKFVKELTRIGKMLKLMVTRMVLRQIISGIGDGFKNLAQYSSKVNASISLLWNSFRQLGNSIAAAVSPLLNALAPALNTIIQLAVNAANAINQLISALLGLGTWTKAKTLTDSYADSLKKAGGAAKELKKTVLGFDELNQLQDNKGSGGGATDPSDMFEEAGISDLWKNWADKLKEMWAKADFTELGAVIGQKLLDALNKIPWNKIKRVARKIGKSLATLINGFIETEGLGNAIGRTIAQAINTGFEFANSFVRNFHWESLGKFISDTFNGFFANIDWKLIKETVVGGFKGLSDSITAFIKGFNWDSISETIVNALDVASAGIKSFFENIDWGDLGTRVGEQLAKVIKETDWKQVGEATGDVIQAAIDFVASIIDQLSWDDVKQAIQDLLEGFFNSVDRTQLGTVIKSVLGVAIAAGVGSMTLTAAKIIFIEKIKSMFTAAGASKTVEGAATTVGGSLGSFMLTGLSAVFLAASIAEIVKTAMSDVKKYKEYMGVDSFWDAIFDTSKESQAAKRAYAEQKASNPYLNGTVSQDIKEIAGQSVVEQAKASAEIKKSTQERINAYKQENKEFAFVSSHNQSIVEQTARKVKESTASMDSSFATSKQNITRDMTGIEKNIQMSTTNIQSNFTKDKWTFSGVADGLKSTFEDAVQGVKSVWNRLADSLSGSFTIGTKSFNINLPRVYATGGFPEDGLFMANHNELVGRFSNGKTAVANNEQITNGIAQAVYSAITAANSGSSGQYINNTIMVDGVAIARAVTKGQERLDRRYSPTMA